MKGITFNCKKNKSQGKKKSVVLLFYHTLHIDNLKKLQQRLYFIHAEEIAGNDNFLNEKMGIINFLKNQLEKIADTTNGTEYIIRIVSSLQKGVLKTASGILNTILKKLGNVMPEMHLPGYNFCGPFTILDKRLARGDELINELDAGCKQHDIFCSDHNDTKDTHVADKKLADFAKERMYAGDASIAEKINSALVRAAMNSKVSFGMGLKY